MGLLPALGAGIAGLKIAPVFPAMTMFRHIVFGLVIGSVVSKMNGGKIVKCHYK